MAVVQMDKIHLCAMKRDRKKILELLQRRNIVEVRDAGGADEVFSKTDTSATCALLEKNAETAERAVEILDKATQFKKPGLAFLRGREAVTPQDSDGFAAKREAALRTAQRIVQLDRDMAEANAEILRLEAQVEMLTPWMGLPVPQMFNGTKKTAVFIGLLEGEHTLDGILAKLAEAAPGLDALHVEIVFTSKEQTCFYLMVLKKDAAVAEEALRAIGFARPPSPSSRLPEDKKKSLLAKQEKAKEVIEQAGVEIASYAEQRDDLVFLQDHMTMRAEKYGVIEHLIQSKHVFVLTGYLPSEAAPALTQELEQGFECAVETEFAGEPGEEVPVLVRNRWFTEPTTSVLEAYSMPGKGEVDPINVMSIFYYVMFGLMFSDFGYGLIMFAVCLVCLLKFKNMESNWSRNVRMFMWCGLSTMFWGVIFSSYFGDIVDVVSSTFFGHMVSIPPAWFLPTEKPMLLLVFCLGIGVIHLTMGYIMKGVTCAKNKDPIGIVFDAICPILAWYPLVLILMGSDMFVTMAGFKLNLPEGTTQVCLAITALALVGTVLFSGRESKSWAKRIMKGIYGVYNLLSGWLSDTLSYSRLLALGLATGVIASVMNKLASLGGASVLGVIVFIAIFLVGHALNFGINVLGAYVHSNRLEYVEFFGKFYDGGGQKFSPFGIHTKHYKIVEEDTSK